MTEDTDADRAGDQPSAGGEPQSQHGNSGATREQWESLAADPDTSADLGYDIAEWEQFQQLDRSDAMVFLPSDEEQLRDEMFIVAEESALAALERYR